jgi:hypothetical protein
MPAFGNNHGNERWWTRDRVIGALRMAARKIPGQLPCSDADYNAVKRGHLEWPTSLRIYEYFGSIAAGWLEAGISQKRVSLKNLDWMPQEDTYLLDNAGSKTLEQIGSHLGRSMEACRSRLGKIHHIKARGNQGYLSAAELAKEYRCPYHRVRQALKDGRIKGKYDAVRNSWKVDPGDIDAAVKQILTMPKLKSYRSTAPDVGDYYTRYGLKRIMVEGKLKVVQKEEALV